MKVIVVGLSFFGKKLVSKLNDFDPSNSYLFLDTYQSKWEKLKAKLKIPKADVVLSINGSLQPSGVFDLCIQKKVPLMMMWVGSDVQLAQEAIQNGTARMDYLNYAKHFCEVGWIQDELAQIGIDADIQNFAAFTTERSIPPFPKDKLRVFCYINDRNQEFYGSKEIIALAQLFPDIEFEIVGTHLSRYANKPSNVITHGWVENLDSIYSRCQISLRYPEHDGLATVVLESLALGKHVIYKYPFYSCKTAKNLNEMSQHLAEFQTSFNRGELKQNVEGISFIKREFNAEIIFSSLVQQLKQHAKK